MLPKTCSESDVSPGGERPSQEFASPKRFDGHVAGPAAQPNYRFPGCASCNRCRMKFSKSLVPIPENVALVTGPHAGTRSLPKSLRACPAASFRVPSSVPLCLPKYGSLALPLIRNSLLALRSAKENCGGFYYTRLSCIRACRAACQIMSSNLVERVTHYVITDFVKI